jgi:superfamily II DNA or RNA helicase
MDEIDITNFLPKYPNIKNNKKYDVLNPYSDSFYDVIYKKKEFYDERLEKIEEFPKKIGKQMKQQKIIARFLSSYTPYDQLLLIHEMGTGKTCTAIGVIEKIRKEKGSGFNGSLIFAKGETLLNNFRNELIFRCTEGQYIPKFEGSEKLTYDELLEEYNNMTELEKSHRTKKMIKDYYDLNTFETFARKLNKLNDSDIERYFSNKIIVIDEVHNLRQKDLDLDLDENNEEKIKKDKKDQIDIYNEFYRLCHNVKNCKILLMSGTPMKDTPDELASIMNLILPKKDHLLIDEQFIKNYFIKNKDDNILDINKKNIEELKQKLIGRISYLRNMQSDVKKIYKGDKIGNLKYFKVYEDYMSDFQTDGCLLNNSCPLENKENKLKYLGYNGAYERDSTEKGVYTHSRQASLFVYPDGSYGKDGFEKYLKKINIQKTNKKQQKSVYVLTNELIKELQGNTTEIKLEKLEKFSSKYSKTIRNILKAYEDGKSCFIYIEYVKGSGAILFSKILELFGYKQTYGQETTEDKRYSIITNETSTSRDIRSIIKTFNNPLNSNGKIISVIIGSKVIGEGFSLNNVQEEYILTPHWNYSETEQAIYRGYRLGSHNDLLKKGITPILNIYQMVSIPGVSNAKNYISIDLQMYETSEIKDINIKKLEKILAEISIDCNLNYNRNIRKNLDNERDCYYSKCNFKCYNSLSNVNNEDLDYSTYQIYYTSSSTQNIIDAILLLFKSIFTITLNDLYIKLNTYNSFEINNAITTIINKSIKIINKYGFINYLKEENNILFLVDSLSVSSNYLSEYYSKNPIILNTNSFNDILINLEYSTYPLLIENIFNKNYDKEFLNKLIFNLPIELQEYLLESLINADVKNINKNTKIRKILLDIFKDFYIKINDTWISTLLNSYDDSESYKCLINDKWTDCSSEYIDLISKQKEKEKEKLINNPYGYYGQYDPTLKKFWLRSVADEKNISDVDKRKQTRGKDCKTWDRIELATIIIKIFKIKPDQTFINNNKSKNKKQLLTDIENNKWCNKIYENYSSNEKNKIDIDELKRCLYWAPQKREELCTVIYNFLNNNNLLEIQFKTN